MEKLSPLRFDSLAGYARTPFTLITADEREWFSAKSRLLVPGQLESLVRGNEVCSQSLKFVNRPVSVFGF